LKSVVFFKDKGVIESVVLLLSSGDKLTLDGEIAEQILHGLPKP